MCCCATKWKEVKGDVQMTKLCSSSITVGTLIEESLNCNVVRSTQAKTEFIKEKLIKIELVMDLPAGMTKSAYLNGGPRAFVTFHD